MNSNRSEKQARRFRSLSLSDFEWSPTSRYDQNGVSSYVNYDCRENGRIYADDEQFQGGNESVSSTEDLPGNADVQVSQKVVPQEIIETRKYGFQKIRRKHALKLVCGLSVALLAVFAPLLWTSDPNDGHYLVPT